MPVGKWRGPVPSAPTSDEHLMDWLRNLVAWLHDQQTGGEPYELESDIALGGMGIVAGRLIGFEAKINAGWTSPVTIDPIIPSPGPTDKHIMVTLVTVAGTQNQPITIVLVKNKAAIDYVVGFIEADTRQENQLAIGTLIVLDAPDERLYMTFSSTDTSSDIHVTGAWLRVPGG